MDEPHFLQDLLECSVCFEQLDFSSKVLPCQHTFCRRCLDGIVQTHKELRCPECRILVDTDVNDLPSNILLIRLLEGIRTHGTKHHHHHQHKHHDRRSASLGRLTRRHHGHHHHHSTSSSMMLSRPSHHAVFRIGQEIFTSSSASTSPSPGVNTTTTNGTSNGQQPEPRVTQVKALFTYDAQDSGELSFSRGDVLTIQRRLDQNWLVGERPDGRSGLIPVNYVQGLVTNPPTPSVPHCRALYDFSLADKDTEGRECLSFKKGETIFFIRRIDDNWAEGRIGDRVGIFPLNFVEVTPLMSSLLKQPPPRILDSNNDQQPSSKSIYDVVAKSSPSMTATNNNNQSSPVPTTSTVTSISTTNLDTSSSQSFTNYLITNPKRHSMCAPSSTSSKVVHQRSTSNQLTNRYSHYDVISSRTSPKATSVKLAELPNNRNNQPSILFSAMFDYRPQKADELELVRGDVYSVSEKCLDGWFKGSNVKTGLTGVFPGNYVQPVESVSSHVARYESPQTIMNGQPDHQTRPKTQLVQASSAVASVVQSWSRHQQQQLQDGNSIYSKPRSLPLNPRGNSSVSEVVAANEASTEVKENGRNDLSPQSPTWEPAKVVATQKRSLSSGPSTSHRTTNSSTTEVKTPTRTCQPSKSTPVTPSTSGRSSPVEDGPKSKTLTLIKKWTKRRSKSPPATMYNRTNFRHNYYYCDNPVFDRSSPTQFMSSTTSGHIRSGSCPSTEATSHQQFTSRTLPRTNSSTMSTNALPPPHVMANNQLNTRRERYRVVAPFLATTDRELALNVGDYVYVQKKREDGWFRGIHWRTGQSGLFPGSFVQMV